MPLSIKDRTARTVQWTEQDRLEFAVPHVENSPGGSRDPALDFIKGVLVVAMTAYHAGTLFIVDAAAKSFVVGIVLDFVSGSWVFLSGLLVSSWYRGRFSVDPKAVTLRLWRRAVKLLALFFILNAVIYHYHLIPHPTDSLDITTVRKILWHGDAELSSFEVLVGIGYTLALAPVVLWLGTWGPMFITALVGMGVLAQMSGNGLSLNSWLVIYGLGGMLGGFLLTSSWLGKIRATSGGRAGSLAIALLGTAVYYTLEISYGYRRADIHVYLLGIVCIFFTFYFSYVWLWPNSIFDRVLRLFGRYSLLCYVGQMGLFWILFSWGRLYLPVSYWLMLLITMSVLLVGIKTLDSLLRQSKPIKAMYSVIFE